METKNKETETDTGFHAVDFMRNVRLELSEKYLLDREQYMQDLKKAMEDFKRRQEKAYRQHGYFGKSGTTS
jgi:hypothetical protein